MQGNLHGAVVDGVTRSTGSQYQSWRCSPSPHRQRSSAPHRGRVTRIPRMEPCPFGNFRRQRETVCELDHDEAKPGSGCSFAPFFNRVSYTATLGGSTWSPPIGSSLVKRYSRSPASAVPSSGILRSTASRQWPQGGPGSKQPPAQAAGRGRRARRPRGGADRPRARRRSTRLSASRPKAAAGFTVAAPEGLHKVEAHLAVKCQDGAGDAAMRDVRHPAIGAGEQRDARRCIALKTGSISMRTRARAPPSAGACPGHRACRR